MVGSTIAHYRITAKLGEGGMGEVYRATDTKLSREVAIKVLPPALASNPDRMARFEREAKLLAQLNHPNIAAIYGVEERALIMELVEGPTLAERIKGGPIPLEEAMHIANQIRDALDYAHEKAIIHRDLKPANVKVNPEGVVKVLDFGLAKAVAEDPAPAEHGGNSPTLTMGETRAGVILGTAGYMSPEQAKGKRADKRADIWAFGVVLYEMLTGKRLFEGETVSETLAAVLMKEPDLSAIPKEARPIVESCLEKDTKKRLRDIGDLKRISAISTTSPALSLPRFRYVPWAAAAALLAAALGISLWTLWPRAAQLKPLVRVDSDLGYDVPFSVTGPAIAISPDGARLAFVSGGRVLTRLLDQSAVTELTGAVGASAPFFSPDGQWVAYFSQGRWKKVSVQGGSPVDLAGATNPRGGSWGEDGNIVVGGGHSGGTLLRIPGAGGATPQTISNLASSEVTHRWPQTLNGGRAVLFTSHYSLGSGFDQAVIEVLSLPDGRRKVLQRGATYGRYMSTENGRGYLLYLTRGTLFAVPFDVNRLEVRGTPSPVLDKVAYDVTSGAAHFDFARNGTMIYRAGGVIGGSMTVQWLDQAGRSRPILAKPGEYERPRVSPDGNQVAGASQGDIWVYDSRREALTPLTFGGGTASNTNPVWTPDGRFILFQAQGAIAWTRADGASRQQPLISNNTGAQLPWSFSDDGKRLAFMEVTEKRGYDLWTVPVENTGAGLRAGKPEPFLRESYDERHPSFSPDGKWLAYSSNEPGPFEVFVRAFPDRGGRWRVSDGGGVYPVWSRNGRELFYRTEDQRIMVAGYTVKGDSFVSDRPRVWTEKRLANVGIQPNYDLAPDGKTVAAVMAAESPAGAKLAAHVTFLFNFGDEIRRRLGEAK